MAISLRLEWQPITFTLQDQVILHQAMFSDNTTQITFTLLVQVILHQPMFSDITIQITFTLQAQVILHQPMFSDITVQITRLRWSSTTPCSVILPYRSPDSGSFVIIYNKTSCKDHLRRRITCKKWPVSIPTNDCITSYIFRETSCLV